MIQLQKNLQPERTKKLSLTSKITFSTHDFDSELATTHSVSLFTRQSRESIKASVTLYRHTSESSIVKVTMGYRMLVATLYEYNTLLIRNKSHDQKRLCNVIRYLAAWFSRHATGPISSSTALRDSSRKNDTYR